MPKRVWLARHLPQVPPASGNPLEWDPEAELAPEAAGIAERVRSVHLDGVRFDVIGHSSLRRTRLSIDLLIPAEARTAIPEYYKSLEPEGMDTDWDWVADMKDGTSQEAFELAPKIMRREGARVWGIVEEAARQLVSGGDALLVSHAPLVEASIAAATDMWPPKYNFGKGDIGIFVFEGGRFVDFLHKPVP